MSEQAIPDPKPRYRWRHTWPDKGDDFMGFDGDRKIGRIYRAAWSPDGGAWCWYWQADGPDIDRRYSGSAGTVKTARLAAKVIEDLYDRAKVGASLLDRLA
ncbi:MAG: hypothetical protein BGN85_09485 [Alphaproteobacteria bacterium 64-11]|jgi:hypothetical protein|nr:MAG: hypothetical protein BGN85_09485 [Alphaproteobacteria bacterium 64-11]